MTILMKAAELFCQETKSSIDFSAVASDLSKYLSVINHKNVHGM